MIFLIMLMLFIPVRQAYPTGTPVIDISAILTEIQNFAQTLSYYQQQIQQWISEAQRIADAAQAISEGEWQRGVDSLLASANSIANTMGGYFNSTAPIEVMQFINRGVDSGYGLVDLVDTISTEGARLESLWSEDGMAFEATSSGFESINNILDASQESVSAIGTMLQKSRNFAAMEIAMVGEGYGAANELSSAAEKMEELTTDLNGQQQAIGQYYSKLQAALQRGNTTEAEQYRALIESTARNIDLLTEEINSRTNNLEMALDAEDRMMAARAESVVAMNNAVRARYQGVVVDAMYDLASDDEAFTAFVTETMNKMEGELAGSSGLTEDSINIMNNYYDAVRAEAAKRTNNTQRQ